MKMIKGKIKICAYLVYRKGDFDYLLPIHFRLCVFPVWNPK